MLSSFLCTDRKYRYPIRSGTIVWKGVLKLTPEVVSLRTSKFHTEERPKCGVLRTDLCRCEAAAWRLRVEGIDSRFIKGGSVKKRTQFCINCGKETPYHVQEIFAVRKIRGKEYRFAMAAAFCGGCGEAVSPPGLFDDNAARIFRQYREKEGIVSAELIGELEERCRAGKMPLPPGIDETALAGYLAGQIPSAEDSERLRKALQSSDFIMQNPEAGEHLGALSEKMRSVIFYLLREAEQVTPLSLQKMLYFIQGLHMAFYGSALFPEDCQAWAHGPVYKEVYEVFRGFRYDPIEDRCFFNSFMRENEFDGLSGSEKKVVGLVAEALGKYSGKALEKVTHEETPWKEARAGCSPEQRSAAVISKEAVRAYFLTAASQYDFTSAAGIREYIDSRL